MRTISKVVRHVPLAGIIGTDLHTTGYVYLYGEYYVYF